MEFEILGIIVAYYLIVLAIGFYCAKLTKTSLDYLVASHRFGVLLSTFCWFTTYFSAVSVFGFTGGVYRAGWSLLWLPCMWAMGSILGVAIAARLRRTRFIVPQEFYRIRFKAPGLQTLVAVLSIIAILISLIVQLKAMGIVWSLALGRPFEEGVILATVVTLIYTVSGGLFAVAWTDVVQGVLFTAVLVFGGIWILDKLGGVGALYAAAAAINTPPTIGASPTPPGLLVTALGLYTPFAVLTLYLNWTPGVAAHVRYTHTMQAAKNVKTAIIMYMISWPILLVLYLCMGFVALGGRVLIPTMPKGMEIDWIFPLIFKTYMHPVMAGLLFAGLLAAAMSTIDHELQLSAAMATVEVKTYYPKLSDKSLLWMARALTVVLTVIAMIITFYPIGLIIEFSAYMWGILGISYFGPMFFGLYIKRINKLGATAGVLGGLIVFILWQALWGTRIYGIIPAGMGVLVSIVVTFLASYATAPPPEEHWKPFFPTAGETKKR